MESVSNKLTLKYHDIFNYPLTSTELKKWKVGHKFPISTTKSVIHSQFSINKKQNFYFINGKQNIIRKRLQNQKYSQVKLKIAKRVVDLISKITTVKFVGITGALAMMNADRDSDIDLLIITRINTLWTTRLFVYLFICLFRIQIRKPRNKQQKDRLCLNMWMDESDLIWDKKDRNIYTAHEIAQIVPLINKDKTYEKFIYLNRWVLNYWPNVVKIYDARSKMYETKKNPTSYILHLISRLLENVAYKLQYFYMRGKITREVVTSTRAIFHPNDWGKVVIIKLSS